jgi:hypothetical protein
MNRTERSRKRMRRGVNEKPKPVSDEFDRDLGLLAALLLDIYRVRRAKQSVNANGSRDIDAPRPDS